MFFYIQLEIGKDYSDNRNKKTDFNNMRMKTSVYVLSKQKWCLVGKTKIPPTMCDTIIGSTVCAHSKEVRYSNSAHNDLITLFIVNHMALCSDCWRIDMFKLPLLDRKLTAVSP